MSALTPLKLRVAAITRETPDAVTVHFEDPTGRPLPAYRAGQYLTLILPVPDPANGGRPVRRAYSLSSAPHENACAVTVKQVAGGLASRYIVNQLRAGDTLDVLPPLGSFTTDFGPTQARQFVLVGGGSGVTPLMSIAKTVLREEPQSRILLIYGNRDREATIFHAQLTELAANSGGRLVIEHVLEAGECAYPGRFSVEIFKQIMQARAHDVRTGLYFLCGPEGLMNAARTALDDLGVPPAQVWRESFTAPTAAPVPAPTEPAVAKAVSGPTKVKIHFEGTAYDVTVELNQSILDAGLDAGIDLPYSCQAGLCTACRGKCLSGAIRMDEREGLSDAEIAKGYVLLCVGHPTTDDVSVEIG
ncbi:MAG: 2Fe-2S iron-sulfur cluster binding domain-containing protein [Hymenobacteraceae bacterium]|nr:2Fe-2S iron-sulfur cluster binding domain-containing protein [Hymenobacteraceae bacterium]